MFSRRQFLAATSVGLWLPTSLAKGQAAEGGRYALVVGISNYKNGYALLDYAGDDAEKVRVALKGLGYRVSSLTTDAQAGAVQHQALLEAMKDLLSERKPEDTVLFYFSGHGSLRNNKQYLLCTDTDPNLFEETAFSLDTMGRLLKGCRAEYRVLIIDACRDTAKADGVSGFAGGRLDKEFKDRLDTIARQAPVGIEAEAAVLYACRPGQRSKESDAEGAGFFTLRLVEALGGRANPTGPLTTGAVLRYVAQSMPAALRGIQDPSLEGAENLLLGSLKRSATGADRRNAQSDSVKINPKDGAEMVFIPAGLFLMGDDDDEIIKTLNPRHTVTLSGYWMYKNLVTVSMYKRFCQETQRQMPPPPDFNLNWSQDDHPMVSVSWEDATAYAKWAGVSLPTDAQWEKAARGTEAHKYPWGNDWDASKLWSSVGEKRSGTAAVGSYPAGVSPYGCLDMAGNVWQSCSDRHEFLKNVPTNDPTGPAIGIFRVVRGGAWGDHNPVNFRASFRYWVVPTDRNDYIGFRCASGQN